MPDPLFRYRGLAFLIVLAFHAVAQAADPITNIVVILTDDQGYADVGCFGATGFTTPNLDRMAEQGRRFTNFYVSQAVCGASRASLLTGCYANRIGMTGAPDHTARRGIHADEILISEVCKQRGYATAIFGKWHLGHRHPFLPLQNGFDEYYGLPYSNDMWPFHSTNPSHYPNLPMYSGNQIVNANVTADDQREITASYTAHAVDFIHRHRSEPFFLYVPYAMPHVPLFAGKKFAGKSEQGAYGDVIMEIDDGVGQILKTLDEHKLSQNTLVIFTSDNGPWISYGNHAGSTGPLREAKGTSWEGGVRVPCIMRWPGRIPAGTTCDELASTIDLLPTIAKLIGAQLPNHAIDGLDIWPLMSAAPEAKSPHEYFCYYWGMELQAIRAGDWKLHFPHAYRSLTDKPGHDGTPGVYQQLTTPLALYNLRNDLGEQHNVATDHPDVVQQLEAYAKIARQELGDSRLKLQGTGFRATGQVAD